MLARSLIATTALLAAGAAIAQEAPVVVYAQPSDTLTERVSYADLNLGLTADQRILDRRVSSAVRRVCRFEPGLRGLSDNGYFRCAAASWSDARPQIGQAIARAREIALTGSSSIPAAPIRIAAR